ncbi:MAG TPA: hypothetical protein VFJ64_04800 [Solirubrobacterales bacterium]|nr:hypothetical protein [Solirubrobacterales bacterium]
MKDTGGPEIVPFEVTGGQDRADEIMDGGPSRTATGRSWRPTRRC